MRGCRGVTGESAGARQPADRLECRHGQERCDDACHGIAGRRDQNGEDRRLAGQQRARVGARGTAGELALGGEQGRLACLHGGQHATLGTEGAHLAQAGQRIERGDAQAPGGIGQCRTGARGGARAQPWQRERREREQHTDRERQPGAVDTDQHDEQREKQHRARERDQNAKIEPIERLDIADQAGQHIACLAEAETTGCAAREITEEPHPEVGQRAERGSMCQQPFGVTQHHARDAEFPQCQ